MEGNPTCATRRGLGDKPHHTHSLRPATRGRGAAWGGWGVALHARSTDAHGCSGAFLLEDCGVDRLAPLFPGLPEKCRNGMVRNQHPHMVGCLLQMQSRDTKLDYIRCSFAGQE